MKRPVLVVMAAGLGSRYGGLKQIAPVDGKGHILMDYTIYDACRAGFEEVVCIVGAGQEAAFHQTVGRRVSGAVNLRYAQQRLEDLPEGFTVPEGRSKPWGTAHAVRSARRLLSGPFAVVNADDFYGREAFGEIYRFLSEPGQRECAMVGYPVENTLTEHGAVSRGVCRIDKQGYLEHVTERTHIEARPSGAAYLEAGKETLLPKGTVVSMNLWGLASWTLEALEQDFTSFLEQDLPADPQKAEWFLPGFVNRLLEQGKTQVRVLPSRERWYGVTYGDDMPALRGALAAMRAKGLYPEKLWEKEEERTV